MRRIRHSVRAAAAVRRLREAPENGSGTVLVLGLVGVIALLVIALVALAGAQDARGRAQSAADFGALAGAGAVRWGGDACAVAADAVIRNDAALVSCRVEGGGVVRVEASARAAAATLGFSAGTAKASARAGPRDPAPFTAGGSGP